MANEASGTESGRNAMPPGRGRTGLSLLLVVALVAIGVAAALQSKASPRWPLTISSGTKGGTYFTLGEHLARLLERLPSRTFGEVTSVPSKGATDNVRRLAEREADVALVMAPMLRDYADTGATDLRVLARLYKDVLQVVVRDGAGIESIADLRGKRVFIGAKGSGTQMVAVAALKSCGLQETDISRDDAESYDQAAERVSALVADTSSIDAAFFAAGLPTAAVQRALASGRCRLLDLGGDRAKVRAADVMFEDVRIAANTYPGQPATVESVGTSAYLVCHRELPNAAAYAVTATLYEHITDLLLSHTSIHDITVSLDDDGLVKQVPLHDGAKEFHGNQGSTLVIATGTIGGKYYRLGRQIRAALTQRRIDARVIHSEGSAANADIITQRPALAIMQFDVALAAWFGSPDTVYRTSALERGVVKPTREIRRIAALHRETAHVIVRRDAVEMEGSRPTVRALGRPTQKVWTGRPGGKPIVCLGPKRSGTRLCAEALLSHHQVAVSSITPRYLRVPDMVEQMLSGEIDACFFVSYVPSEAVRALLDDPEFRLLSVEARARTRLAGAAFESITLQPATYGCQLDGEPAVHTLGGRAVLVTTAGLDADVERITEAVFAGEAFLGVEGGAEAMAQELPSLPLHEGAVGYYQRAGFIAVAPTIDWLVVISQLLASLVVLAGAVKGALEIKRARASHELGKRILSVSVAGQVEHTVAAFLKLRTEIHQRVKRKWWHLGELDRGRWSTLHELANQRIAEAKANRTRWFVSQIKPRAESEGEAEAARCAHNRELERRVWKDFERGEIESEQHQMLLGLIQGCTPGESAE